MPSFAAPSSSFSSSAWAWSSATSSSVPWTARIKHHPIFFHSSSPSSSSQSHEHDHIHGAQSLLVGNSSTFSRFANISVLGDSDLLGNDDGVDLDLDLDLPAPRNVLAAVGQILAVIVHGQLRLVSLRAIKAVCASLPSNATEQEMVTALQEHAPYWRVHVPAVDSASSSLMTEPLDSPWLQLQFNQTGRFLALLAAHRLLVIDFGSSLARLADAPIPSQQRTSGGGGTMSSTLSLTASLGMLPINPTTVPASTINATTLGYLDHDNIPTLPATLYELGQSNLAFASATAPLVQCAWHPMSKDHTDLVVLALNAHLSVFSILASINEPVHTYPVLDEQAARDRTNPMMADVHAACTPVAMAFGVMSHVQGDVGGVEYKALRPERVWNKCTVYVAMRDGGIKAVCPVLPRVWNMSLFDYKCMRTSLLTLSQDPSASSPPAYMALARFLTHINTQLDPEHQLRAPQGMQTGLRFSDTPVRDADLPDAGALAVSKADLHTHVFVDAPVYDQVCPYPQPLVLDPTSLPTQSSVDLRAVCTDVCVALAETGSAGDDSNHVDIQVPVVLVAWRSGEVDVMCTDVVWPTWGTRVTESHWRRGAAAAAGEALTWVVRQGEHAQAESLEGGAGVSAFATETIRLDIAPGLVRLAMDPVVAGQVVVAHSEGVHQVVVRLGAPSIAHQVVDTAPLKEFAEADCGDAAEAADASMVVGGGSQFKSMVINASTILGKQQPRAAPPMRNPVLGCVAIGDTMLGHSTIVVTHDDASAAPLYTIDLALADLDEVDIDPAMLPPASRAVLDLVAPFKSPIAPYPFVSLASIPDTLPVVSRLTLPESRTDRVSEQQLEYLASKSMQLGKYMQPLSTLVDQMKDAMDVMRTLEERAQALVQSLAFHKKSVHHKLDAAERGVKQVEVRADGMLQVIHDVRHPAHLTPAERKYHREVVKAAHEVGALADRVGKVVRLRGRFVEWADEERARRDERIKREEEMFGGPVSEEMVGRLMDLLQAQYQAIKRMEDELERVRASEELRKRLDKLEV